MERLDQEKVEQFPEVFQSNKQIRKSITETRKRLHAHDARYKELLFATYRAAREIDQYIIEQHPEYAALPANQKKERLEKWSNAMRKLPREQAQEFLELLEKQRKSQSELEAAYPQLFVSDNDIKQSRNAARANLKGSPEFRRCIEKRAAAWRAQQNYLLTHDQLLSDLNQRMLESQPQ